MIHIPRTNKAPIFLSLRRQYPLTPLGGYTPSLLYLARRRLSLVFPLLASLSRGSSLLASFSLGLNECPCYLLASQVQMSGFDVRHVLTEHFGVRVQKGKDLPLLVVCCSEALSLVAVEGKGQSRAKRRRVFVGWCVHKQKRNLVCVCVQ